MIVDKIAFFGMECERFFEPIPSHSTFQVFKHTRFEFEKHLISVFSRTIVRKMIRLRALMRFGYGDDLFHTDKTEDVPVRNNKSGCPQSKFAESFRNRIFVFKIDFED